MSEVAKTDRLAFGCQEAADTIGVSRQYIYNLMRRGQLRTVKVGRRRLIPRSALLELLGESEAT
jgi:excisionase family DNA binding protein